MSERRAEERGPRSVEAVDGRVEPRLRLVTTSVADERDVAHPRPAHGTLRWVLLVSGSLLTVLGTVGAFLPVLPTTPFLLLAAACFVRSSPALHRRLLANRVFGPYIAQWQRERTIPADAKRKGYGLVALTFTVSIVSVEGTALRLVLAVLGASLIALLASLPTSRAAR